MAVAAAVVSSAVLWAGPSGPVGTAQSTQGMFAFLQSFDGGHSHHVYVVNVDGSSHRRLVHVQAVSAPAFSPDGTEIVFAGEIGAGDLGRLALFVIGSDGTALRQITDASYAYLDPAWSPDGEWIAFTLDLHGTMEADTCCLLGLIRPDGTGLHHLEGTIGGSHPAWSPDSSRLVFQRANGIWEIGRDGSGLRQLAAGDYREPAWSPDGSTLAFALRGDPNSQILTMPSGGGPVSVRVDMNGRVETPRWDPDGTTIYFVHHFGFGYDGRTFSSLYRSVSGQSPQQTYVNSGMLFHVARTTATVGPFHSLFADVPASHLFAREIAWLAREEITRGCGPNIFCPDEPTTRAQMASFWVRALDLSPASEDHFADDAGSVHEADINALAQAGITIGCGDRIYCPVRWVTRAQFASFMVRAFDLPPATQDHFDDDSGSIHEVDINALAEAGITRGCGNGLYCPDRAVNRGEVAALFYRSPLRAE